MGFLWIVLIGFVAGIIARLLSSAPNKPTGFILTHAFWHHWCLPGHLHRSGSRLVCARSRRWVYRGNPWRDSRTLDFGTALQLCRAR